MMLPIARSALLALTLGAITACGFHLRDHSSLPTALQPIYIGGAAGGGPLAGAMRYQLSNSDIKVTPYVGAANYRLILLSAGQERRIISLDKSGLAAEYGLTEKIEFELLDRTGQRVLGPIKLQEMRTVNNNPNDALTTGQEVSLVQSEITKSLAAQLARRLGAFATHLPPAAPTESEAEPTASSDSNSTPTNDSAPAP